ncbi:magnesium chelatase subunit D [Sphingomonas rosea]|uniref:Magnesium chelatase subunit D n=2 Tax=Sphingomonas rosea TaxID=335605 RepID=A0ABP7U7P7_9SPHN
MAARLVAARPERFGGIWLKGVEDEDGVWDLLPHDKRRKLPCRIDEERLVGGLDVGATLAAGRPVHRPGLLSETIGSCLMVSGAERLETGTAGRIAAALDSGGPALILLDRGQGDEPGAPTTLTERVAFHFLGGSGDERPEHDGDVMNDDEAIEAIATSSVMLGIASARADLFAFRAARAHAEARGLDGIDPAALTFAARTVLAPRATRLPEESAPPPPEPDAAEQPQQDRGKLEDVVLEAVRTALPADLLAALIGASTSGRRQSPQGAGARNHSPLRGRTIGARRGRPGGGARLAILDTLRAAAPWQRLRGRTDRIRLGPDDLRVRRHESRSASLTIIAVDASGSAAAQRLAEAKGAAETLLQQSYVRRAEVAVIAVRGASATLLLPPTRSLTRAKRLLSELPGGGGTPLAAGIESARELAEAAASRGRTPSVVLLTDGRANIALDGSPGRETAMADATRAARRLAATGTASLVIDIGARARPEAADLARGMNGRYLHMPLADGASVGRAAGVLVA